MAMIIFTGKTFNSPEEIQPNDVDNDRYGVDAVPRCSRGRNCPPIKIIA